MLKSSLVLGHKKYIIKALLVVFLLTGLILLVRCAKGRVHDFGFWKQNMIKLNPDTVVHADLGFRGLDKLHHKTVLPYKASKLHPLTKQQKQQNRSQAKVRVKVEHVNRACKIFRLVKDT